MAAQTKKKINFICYCVFIFSFPFHLDVVIFNEKYGQFPAAAAVAVAQFSNYVACRRSWSNILFRTKRTNKYETQTYYWHCVARTQIVEHANDEKTNHAMCVEDVNK